MEKQIEELAKYICNACEMGNGFEGECALGNDYRKCGISTGTAEALYNADYRKQSDTVREIFAEIETAIKNLEYQVSGQRKTVPVETMVEVCNWLLQEVVPQRLAELKKEIHGK